MNLFSAIRCRRVVARASAMLDGRVDAKERAALQRHLRDCATCTRSVQQMARLSRATHNLPQHRAAAGLAERVRGSLEARRGDLLASLDSNPPRSRTRTVRAVAAIVVVALAWSFGFFVRGIVDAPEEFPPPDGLVQRPRSEPDATFAATSRRVLSDLAWMPELPQRARRPLLIAQFDLFDLNRRAARVLAESPPSSAEHELARLVVDLAATLEDESDLQQPEMTRAPATHRLAGNDQRDPPLDPSLVRRVVDRHATDLTVAERDDLGHFLEFKRELVERSGATDRTFVQTFTSRVSSGSTSFAVATGFAGARDLADTGQAAAAAELERTLHEMLRAMQPPRRP